MKNIYLYLLLPIMVCSCQSTSYFFNESDNEIYTELHLNSNGTFSEYFYLNIQDSLVTENFGNMIAGTYKQIGDTLFLTYQPTMTNATVKEVYYRAGNELIKLAPITYSHHFLHMVFTEGKSAKLRGLEYYKSIEWRVGL